MIMAAPRATLRLLLCSPILPRAPITRYMHAMHRPILYYNTRLMQLEVLQLTKAVHIALFFILD